ncbi:hypothetical protein EDB19DRAFT_1904161 [Suillus lakei]|nr:hypothetical protein EDB19DRAFT_1904161 [Suillus lakei]
MPCRLIGSLTWRRSTIISTQHHNLGKVSTNSRPLGYGDEIQRLMIAEADAKKAFNIAKRAGVAPAVLSNVKLLLDVVQKNLARAEREKNTPISELAIIVGSLGTSCQTTSKSLEEI